MTQKPDDSQLSPAESLSPAGAATGEPTDQPAQTASSTARDSQHWYLYRGPNANQAASTPFQLPPPPPWRAFGASRQHKAQTFQPKDEAIKLVNAALYLRRPLLITGLPGTGKSSLAYAVAAELGLGDVLVWSITSRSQLKDGLYQYDAIGRLQATNLTQQAGQEHTPPPIGTFLRLGPLGSALADSEPHRPRVLLIDEIDKSDIDLPNDLLNIFEEGEFEIPELARLHDSNTAEERNQVEVRLDRPRDLHSPATIAVQQGRIQCREFPFVILTSNGERALPAPLLRRCLRLHIEPPKEKELQEIVRQHFVQLSDPAQPLPPVVISYIRKLIERRERKREYVATDQLLNAVYLLLNQVELTTSPHADKAEQERANKQLEDFILEAIGSAQL